MHQITINWWIKEGKTRIRGTDTFSHHIKLTTHTASDYVDTIFEKADFASKLPNFFKATTKSPLQNYGVSTVKCTKIVINKKSLTAILGNVTQHNTDGYKYRRTVYHAEIGDFKIKVYVYTYHQSKTKDYALHIEQNSHIKDGTPEAKALLTKHGNLSTYQSNGDCYITTHNQDYQSPEVLLETLRKFIEKHKLTQNSSYEMKT